MTFIARWLERGAAGRSPEAAAIARRLRAFTLSTALLVTLVGAADVLLGRREIVAVESAAALAFFALHLWGTAGSDRRVRVAAHLFLATGFLTIVIVETEKLAHARVHANTYWYAPLVPLAAAHLLGTRAAARWTMALVLSFVAQTTFLATTNFPLQPRPVSVGDVFEQALLALVALAIADGSRRAADLHLASAHEERAVAQAATKEAIANAAKLERANRALDEARAAAERANEAKRHFLANMSHEIRTPLHGVIGMTELLATTPLTTEQADYLRTVRSSSDSLLALLNDVLDFSKIEAGRMNIERVEFSLVDTIEHVTALFAEAAQSKGLELICAIDPALPERVIGDPVRLRQVLSNLVSNAVKFTPTGEVCVHAAIASAPNRVAFEVRDSGIGIEPEAQARLFEMFEQADVSTSRQFGGTGLGLAISRHLARLLGGTLDVRSEPPAGSCFRLELPLQATGESPLARECESLAGRRALLVEPHPAQRAAVAACLASAGVVVCSVPDAAGALHAMEAAAARNERYDFALASVALQHADDFEIARRMPGDGELAVIWLTPAATLATAGATGQATPFPSVPKPVRRSVLLDAVRAVLGLSTRSSAPSATPASASGAPFASMRVLVAEDNVVNQRIALRFLERLGAEVVLSCDGADAVECVRKDRDGFDLVLMDCQMPRLDGYAATTQIRALYDASRLPIIAVSANVVRSDLERCLAVGMNDVLPKPYTVEQLKTAISRWMPPAPGTCAEV